MTWAGGVRHLDQKRTGCQSFIEGGVQSGLIRIGDPPTANKYVDDESRLPVHLIRVEGGHIIELLVAPRPQPLRTLCHDACRSGVLRDAVDRTVNTNANGACVGNEQVDTAQKHPAGADRYRLPDASEVILVCWSVVQAHYL